MQHVSGLLKSRARQGSMGRVSPFLRLDFFFLMGASPCETSAGKAFANRFRDARLDHDLVAIATAAALLREGVRIVAVTQLVTAAAEAARSNFSSHERKAPRTKKRGKAFATARTPRRDVQADGRTLTRLMSGCVCIGGWPIPCDGRGNQGLRGPSGT